MTQRLIELSKINHRGVKLIWRAELNDNIAKIFWGQENGKFQQITRTVSQGKQGRNLHDQLILEVESIANKKIQKNGYKRENLKNSEDLTNLDIPLPMLAKNCNFNNFSLVEGDKCYMQPKLDGLRCIADLRTGTLWSRSRKKIENLSQISESILGLKYRNKLIEKGFHFLDGEIYNHELNFQQISSYARRTSKNPHENARSLKLHIFDICIESMNFTNRWKLIESLSIEKEDNTSLMTCLTIPISITSLVPFNIETEMSKWIELGYEGMMLRISPLDEKVGGYSAGLRSSQLLKCKQFFQEEFLILDFQKHRELEMLGSVLLKLDNGKEFSATPANDVTTKIDMWKNRELYNKQNWYATVKYHNLSTEGIPRFPVLVGFRHKDDM